jgi:hypothetical protein
VAEENHPVAVAYTDDGVEAKDTLDGSYAFLPRLTSPVRMNVRRVPVVCQPDEYESRPASFAYVRQCSAITQCAAIGEEYEAVAPTATTDRECVEVAPACVLGGDYELQPPTATSDRVCQPCLNDTALAATSASVPLRTRPCNPVIPPLVEVDLPWDENSAVIVPTTPEPPTTQRSKRPQPTTTTPLPPAPPVPPTVIYANDTVAWTFDVRSAAVVSRGLEEDREDNGALFDSRLTVNTTSVPAGTAPFGTFRYQFQQVGMFEYYNPMEYGWRGIIQVLPRPLNLESCRLNATGALADGTKGIVLLAETVEAEFQVWRRDVPVIFPKMEEDTRGLCQHMLLPDVADALHNATYNGPGADPTAPAAPLPAAIEFITLDQEHGSFEIRQPGSGDAQLRQWQPLGATATAASPISVPLTVGGEPVELRFVADDHYFGLVNIVYRLPSDREFIGSGALEVVEINDSPVLTDGAVVRDIDEDPPEDQREGTPVSGGQEA